jgi:cobaltochelatase CobS
MRPKPSLRATVRAAVDQRQTGEHIVGNATDKQLDTLQALTARDWRPLNLTKEQATDILTKLLSAKEKLGADAARTAGQVMHAKSGGGKPDAEQPATQPETQPEAPQAGGLDPLAAAIVQTVRTHRDAVLDGLDLAGAVQRRVVRIERPDLTHVEVEGQHETFADLVTVVGQRDHVMLVGPAGTGKTSGAKAAAQALGLAWTYWASNPRVTASALLGFMDANGQYVRTQFREAYEHGGIFILDEVDNAAPDLLTALNGAIENGTASFPDGLVERHPDFVVVATANTYGKGADRIYSGRQQLDGATLDRFIVLDWGYDESLERQLAPCDDWTDYVQAVRALVSEAGIREVVSMRASTKGGRYLALGWSWQKVEQTVLFRGWNRDSLTKVEPVRERFASVSARYGG